MASDLWRIEDGALHLDFHAGQARAWRSDRRFTFVLAGTQGGKTSFGPWWVWREIQRTGGGDHLAITSSYDLFKLKMLPLMQECFEQVLGIGRYWSGDRILEIADPTTGQFLAKRVTDPMWARVILRSASSGGGLESSTARSAWCDEAGQDEFRLETWEAILRRLSLHQGRVLGTTTIYNLGWVKTEIYDRWRKGNPDYQIVQFASTMNPSFPRAEYERARETMPRWRFLMFYDGQYTKPAGLIYDSFDEDAHVVPRFALPAHWPRYLGLDFGGVNTAGLFYAQEPGTQRLYLYREYKAGGRTAREHAVALCAGEPMTPTCVGGSHSEGQWRDEFRAGGLPVREPDIKDVEVGIGRVYGAHSHSEVFVFSDLHGYLDQKLTYRREVDENGEATEQIADKSSYHYMDAERYIVGWLRRPAPAGAPVAGGQRTQLGPPTTRR